MHRVTTIELVMNFRATASRGRILKFYLNPAPGPRSRLEECQCNNRECRRQRSSTKIENLRRNRLLHKQVATLSSVTPRELARYLPLHPCAKNHDFTEDTQKGDRPARYGANSDATA